MRLDRLSIGLKISLAITVLVIAAMTGVAYLIIDYQRDSLRESIGQNNLLMVRNLARDSVDSLLVFDALRLDDLVNTLKEETGCLRAFIADQDGVIVAHTDRSFLGRSVSETQYADLAVLLRESGENVRERPEGDDTALEYAAPARLGTQNLGLVTVAYSRSNMDGRIERSLKRLRQYIYVITGIMVLSGIVFTFGVTGYLTRPLKRLRERMMEVQTGNLDTEIANPRLVRCWERLGCTKTECPSYGKTRCWAVAGTFCHGEVQGQLAQKIGDCRKCVVYKESCGDEINELLEVFNQMVRDLKFNLGELDRARLEKAQMERLSALGEMATTVAHETKNPLNSIRLATAYLKNNFQGEILSEFLGIIEEEVGRLNDITSNFLGFSRPAPLRVESWDLNAIIASTVELARQEATDRNVEIVFLADDRIPAVPCDRARIKQAILNLLVNALDVSVAGGTITVTTEADKDIVRIAVKDTGPGIPESELANIFKPFFTTKTRGSGLGLAVVDRILKEHRGEVLVESRVGEGTRFTLLLPIHEHATVPHSRS